MSYTYCEPHIMICLILWQNCYQNKKGKNTRSVIWWRDPHYSNKLCKCPPLFQCCWSGLPPWRQRSHLAAEIRIPHVTVPAHLPVTTTWVMKLQTLVMRAATTSSSSFSWALQTQGRISGLSGSTLVGMWPIRVLFFEDASQPASLKYFALL